ncbi:MAG: metal-dependent hydrolase [Candidatus Sumerlaeia bacterium]|nr:metal-dependent hydrolase [Candidatus Sumerlaeia bacterium]
MKPSRHVKISAVVSLALAPWAGWKALLVFAGGILPDLDRYLWYAVRFRTLKLDEAVARFQGRERIQGGARLLHSLEALAILSAAGYACRPMAWLTLGVALHVVLDLFVHKKHGRFWIYFDAAHLHSIIGRWIKGRTTAAANEDEE